jgi:hypothetical protein
VKNTTYTEFEKDMIKFWNLILEDTGMKCHEYFEILVLLNQAYLLKIEGTEIPDEEYCLIRARFFEKNDKTRYYHGGNHVGW